MFFYVLLYNIIKVNHFLYHFIILISLIFSFFHTSCLFIPCAYVSTESYSRNCHHLNFSSCHHYCHHLNLVFLLPHIFLSFLPFYNQRHCLLNNYRFPGVVKQIFSWFVYLIHLSLSLLFFLFFSIVNGLSMELHSIWHNLCFSPCFGFI